MASVPRWTILLCPVITYWLNSGIVYMPAPLGLPLAGGWSNVAGTIWFAVLALTYQDQDIGSQVSEMAKSELTGSSKSSEKDA
jgi:hypothetical protein